MTLPVEPSGRRVQRVQRVQQPVRDVLAASTRWQRVEVDALAMLAAGLAVAIPAGFGMATGHAAAGMVAAVGALMVSSSGQVGRTSTRAAELLLSTLIGMVGVALGNAMGGTSVAACAFVVVGAVAAVAFGAVRPSGGKASLQLVVTTIIGTTVAAAGLGSALVAGLFALGAALGGGLTLAAYAVGRLVLRTPRPDQASPPGSWREDLAAWRGSMATRAGWEFPLRLGACMVVGAALVQVMPGSHSTWVLLTVVIVVQRDLSVAAVRTAGRALGTILGVGIGVLMLFSMPGWLMVVVVGLISAVRGHLKAANYAAYSMVMTPLVLLLTGMAHHRSWELLAERVVDTVVGCAVSVIVGMVLWPQLRRLRGSHSPP